MTIALAKEVVTLLLAILGSLGMVATPIVVAVINNRNKKEKEAKAELLPMGQPVDLDQQRLSQILIQQLEDILEVKNAVEERLRETEFENRMLKEKLAEKNKSAE